MTFDGCYSEAFVFRLVSYLCGSSSCQLLFYKYVVVINGPFETKLP